jgi:hypothetical protein
LQLRFCDVPALHAGLPGAGDRLRQVVRDTDRDQGATIADGRLRKIE